MAAEESLQSVIGSAERDFVEDINGNQIKIADLTKNKAIGLYFSAHWCPPCRRFTPLLAAAYKKLKEQQKEVEIVFLSSDNDEKSFKEYFASMPWLAVPFQDREAEKRISEKFNSTRIPNLIFIDGNGKTLTTDGCELIFLGGPDGYPFTDERLNQLKTKEEEERKANAAKSPFELLVSQQRDYFVDNKDEKVTLADVQSKEVVGLYFSAHWCPPCRNFTPVLAKLYEELKSQGKSFEIIFISSDSDEASFKEYHSSMPWLALPFSEREIKEKVSEKYEVRGIPALIFVDGKSGRLISEKGRLLVGQYGVNGFPYSKEKLEEINKVEREKMEKLPKKIKDARHEHELELREEVYQGNYGCDACGKEGNSWVYHCDACQFDLHTSCAKQE